MHLGVAAGCVDAVVLGVYFTFVLGKVCSIRQHTPEYAQNTSAYVSIRQHTSAYVSLRQHTSAYVSIRQHTSAYVTSGLIVAYLLRGLKCALKPHSD